MDMAQDFETSAAWIDHLIANLRRTASMNDSKSVARKLQTSMLQLEQAHHLVCQAKKDAIEALPGQ